MKQLSLFETQNALLALFGLEGEKLITRLQLDMNASDLATLTIEKYVDLTNTPSLETQLRRFEVKLVALDEWDAYQDREADHPAFDLDAACKAATQRVLNHIEDQFTVHSRVIAHDFGAARDQMRSRHAHQRALQPKPYPLPRSFIAQAFANLAKATEQAHA